MSTTLVAEPGKTLPGSDIYDAVQEAKRTGRTLASVMQERFANKARVTTIVSPGDGVVPAKPRAAGR